MLTGRTARLRVPVPTRTHRIGMSDRVCRPSTFPKAERSPGQAIIPLIRPNHHPGLRTFESAIEPVREPAISTVRKLNVRWVGPPTPRLRT